jgi:hypothetical protein
LEAGRPHLPEDLMTLRPFARALLSLAASSALVAQAPPSLHVNEGMRYDAVLGEALTWRVTGTPGAGFVLAADLAPGPVSLLGEEIDLGLSPYLMLIALGVTPATGSTSGSVGLLAPHAAVGTPLFLQALELIPTAPNGVFVPSNPASTVIYDGPHAVVEGFVDPYYSFFTGTFDGDHAFRLRGGPVLRREHASIDPQGAPFFQPVPGPLNHFGSRVQMVFRPRDVGSLGDEERLVAVHWRPFQPLAPETFDLIEILAAHTAVAPDFSIDPFTLLPAFPTSGLAPNFASNYAAPPQSLFLGRYDALPADLRADGYLPYPALAPFDYDGQRSLLLEFRFTPNTARGATLNGQHVHVMVLSDRLPAARVVAAGNAANQTVVIPATATSGFDDNAMADYLFEFARVKTFALSGWYQATLLHPDWLLPIVVADTPPGTSLLVEYRGSANNGGSPTAWSTTPDIADGLEWLQFRVTFVADVATAAVPTVDLVVVPYQ